MNVYELAEEVLLENKALDFLKGGAKVFTDSDVARIMKKIQKNMSLKKKLEVHPVYLSGQKEKINKHKKKTADWFLFSAGQGVAGGRS